METKKDRQKISLFCAFKSYYVVWKPFRIAAFRAAAFRFKSYYVVWKPEDIASIERVEHSLNRTM